MKDAVQIEVTPGLKVWVGGASDLLLSKERAAREKDIAEGTRVDCSNNIRACRLIPLNR